MYVKSSFEINVCSLNLILFLKCLLLVNVTDDVIESWKVDEINAVSRKKVDLAKGSG